MIFQARGEGLAIGLYEEFRQDRGKQGTTATKIASTKGMLVRQVSKKEGLFQSGGERGREGASTTRKKGTQYSSILRPPGGDDFDRILGRSFTWLVIKGKEFLGGRGSQHIFGKGRLIVRRQRESASPRQERSLVRLKGKKPHTHNG